MSFEDKQPFSRTLFCCIMKVLIHISLLSRFQVVRVARMLASGILEMSPEIQKKVAAGCPKYALDSSCIVV
jgi:hypothetical protein